MEKLCEATILENGLPDAGIFIIDDPRKAFALVAEIEARMKAGDGWIVEDSDVFLAMMDEFGRIELQTPEGANLFVLARVIETKAREVLAFNWLKGQLKRKEIVTPKIEGKLRL